MKASVDANSNPFAEDEPSEIIPMKEDQKVMKNSGYEHAIMTMKIEDAFSKKELKDHREMEEEKILTQPATMKRPSSESLNLINGEELLHQDQTVKVHSVHNRVTDEAYFALTNYRMIFKFYRTF